MSNPRPKNPNGISMLIVPDECAMICAASSGMEYAFMLTLDASDHEIITAFRHVAKKVRKRHEHA